MSRRSSASRSTIADHVAVVTLTRPDKHNALDVAMFEQIIAAARAAGREPASGCVPSCCTATGPSFCSGLDVVSIMAGRGGVAGLTDRVQGDVPNWFQRAAHDWLTLPVPVIAALHGNCFGGGLQIALGADIRIAAPDARLSVMEVKWGLVPDMSITRTLPRLVSIDVAKELTYTGRVFDGAGGAPARGRHAGRRGPAGAARAARRGDRRPLAGRRPRGQAAFDESWTAPAAATLALEAELQLGLIGSPNQLAAVSAGFTKQPAEFVDP